MKTKTTKTVILAVGLFLIFGFSLPAQAKHRHKIQNNNYYMGNYNNYGQGYGNYGYGNGYGYYGYINSGYGYPPYPSTNHFYSADLDPSYGPYPGCWADPNQNRIFCNPGRH